MKANFIRPKILAVIFFSCFHPLCAQTSSSSPVSTIGQVAKMYHLDWQDDRPKSGESLSGPQMELLKDGLRWAMANLKCEQLNGLQTWQLGEGYKPRFDKCTDLWVVQFGSFDELGSPGLLLAVTGGGAFGAHGAAHTDEKFIFCQGSKNGFLVKMLEKDDRPALVQVIKRPHAPDLLWIGDYWNNPMFDTPPGQARLYQEVGGGMKKVLTYEYILTEWQRPDGFATRLLPDEKDDIHLLKYTRDSTEGDMTHFKEVYTDTTFKWSSFWSKYKKDGEEKPVSRKKWETESDYGTVKSAF